MRTLVKEFVKEQVPILITFFFSSLFIIAFYTIEAKEEVELIYPISLAVSCFAIYFAFQFYRFVRFHRALEKMVRFQENDIRFSTFTEQQVQKALYQVHHNYSKDTYLRQQKEREEKRFFSTWIHSMKTPLSVSYLLMQRFKRKEINNERYIKQMEGEQEKLVSQLDLVLNMLRLKEFVKDYTPTPISLSEEVNRIINQNRNLFICNQVFPRMEEVNERCTILSDQKWNDLVITQLISNGVKYSALKGEGEEKYLYFAIRKEDERIVLSIWDEGVGIPEYDMPRIYEAFFTGENGRRTDKSSGIGLYFCKQVCDMLGHELKITSKLGEGTTVTLSYLSKL